MMYFNRVRNNPSEPSAIRDAFGRYRVSEPRNVFNSKLLFGKEPLLWTETNYGDATLTSTWQDSYVQLTIPTGTTGKLTRQTRRYFNYEPGKSQLVFITGSFLSHVDGVTTTIMYGDDDNGIGFKRKSDGTVCVFYRNKTVDTEINQTDWVLTPNVANVSYTPDLSKGQIFAIDFEWLALGRIRWGFGAHGSVTYVHEEEFTNVLDTPYIASPNLPIRYEIESDGTNASNASMNCICSSVISEGGFDGYGKEIGVTMLDSSISGVEAQGSRYSPTLSIRTKPGSKGATFEINNVLSMSVSNSTHEYGLFFDPVIETNTGNPTDPAVWVDIPNTQLQYDITRPENDAQIQSTNGNDLSTHTGHKIFGSYTIESTNDLMAHNFIKNPTISLGFHFNASGNLVPDELVLAVNKMAPGSETYYGAINLTEII